MNPHPPETPVESLALVAVGPLDAARVLALLEAASRRTNAAWRLLPPLSDERLPRLPGRGQVDADAVLAELEGRAASRSVLVGLTSHDLGIPLFTFVLGRARQNGRAALVSAARLDPAYYGLPPDPALLAGRVLVEVLHELGHVAGLTHCADAGCLMSFAASVERVDVRGTTFCAGCDALLPHWLRNRIAR